MRLSGIVIRNLPFVMLVIILVNIARIVITGNYTRSKIYILRMDYKKSTSFYDYLPPSTYKSLWYGMYQFSYYLFCSYKYLLLLWLLAVLLQKVAYKQPLPNKRAQTVVLASTLFYLYFQFVDVFYQYNLP